MTSKKILQERGTNSPNPAEVKGESGDYLKMRGTSRIMTRWAMRNCKCLQQLGRACSIETNAELKGYEIKEGTSRHF